MQCAGGYSLVVAWGSTLVAVRVHYLWWVSSSLALVCRLFLVLAGWLLLVVALLLSSCGRMFSNCDWDDSSLVVMRRDTFSSCDVQDATLSL